MGHGKSTAPRNDLVGPVAGTRWTVLRPSHATGGRWYWWCRCACGVERSVRGDNLTSDSAHRSRSCGCHKREVSSPANLRAYHVRRKAAMPQGPVPRLAARLKALREAAGLSVAEVADRIDVNRETVRLYEAGQRLPGWEPIQRLADLYGVPLDDLRTIDKPAT